MARRNRQPGDRTGMAIITREHRLLRFDRRRTRRQLFGQIVRVIMTRCACQDRYVGVFHRLQIAVAGDTDVAGHTIANSVALRIVIELK